MAAHIPQHKIKIDNTDGGLIFIKLLAIAT